MLKLNKYKNSGQVLMISLWVLAILVVASISISYRMMVEVRLSAFHRDKLKARYLAQACLMKKIEEKQEERLLLAPIELYIPSPDDIDGMRVDGEMSNPESGVEVKYKIIDERGKLNINTFAVADSARRKILENLLIYKCAMDAQKAKELLDKMIDFIDDVPGGDDTQIGNPNMLEKVGYQYKQKDVPITDLSEIKMVEGWEGVFDKISGFLTACGDSAEVNINSCAADVLAALFMPDTEAENKGRQILDFRSGSGNSVNCFSDADREDIKNSLGEDFLAAAPVNLELNDTSEYAFNNAGSEVVFTAEVKKFLTYDSGILRFEVSCQIGKVLQKITAVVRLADDRNTSARILYWYEE